MKKSIYILSFLAITLFSCSNNSEDDLIDPIVIDEGEKVTYITDIKPIFENNCIFCHNDPPVNGAPISLTTFQEVSSQANSIINRISLQAGEPGIMPFGGPRLPQTSIDLVQQWIDDGLLEQ
ncbi:hypothetical protein [Olleya sp. R77988]|uniref:hypothetical protein n=1 Tax=Olleya sp. R77988 TaxID=3093875 RepID=UPI0037C6469C